MNRTAFLISTASVMAISTAAMAQTQVGEIVVTGTRIIRDGYQAPTPVTVATAEELRLATPTSLTEAMLQLPQFTGSVGRSNTTNTLTGSSSATFLSLRNLGSNRTLIMMDGRRMPPTEHRGRVDSGVMPELLVQRVDVVTGGVSAVYGSDAVTGVVNYIIDDQFEGLKLNAQYGMSNRKGSGFRYVPLINAPEQETHGPTTLGDGQSYRIGIAGGFAFADDRAHFVFSLERSHQDPVVRLDRPYVFESWGTAADNPAGRNTAGRSAGEPMFFTNNVSRIDYPYNGYFVDGPVGVKNFGPNDAGILTPRDFGVPTGHANRSIGGNSNYQPQTGAFIAELTNDQWFGKLTYDLTPDIQAGVSWTHASSIGDVDTQGAAMASFTMQADNAFMPQAIKDLLIADGFVSQHSTGSVGAGLPSARFRGRGPDRYPSKGFEKSRLNVITSSIDGRLGQNFSFDVYWSHGWTRAHNGIVQPEVKKWRAAVDAIIHPTTGAVVCRITVIAPGVQDDCVPYDVFTPLRFSAPPGTSGSNNDVQASGASPSAQTYMMGTSEYYAAHDVDYLGASVSGDLFEGWAGPISASVGVEYRDLDLDLSSNGSLAEVVDITGLNGNFGNSPRRWYTLNQGEAFGSYNVKEVFGELAIPLASDVPGIYHLEVSGAARYTDYSTTGGEEMWKIGLSYQPVEQLRFRGAVSRDIRAPTLLELFATEGGARGLPSDPHTGISDSSFIFTGGNPDLLPEEGKTWTGGVVYRPLWAPGLGLSVDYYDIKITDAVGTQSALAIVNECHESGHTALQCSLIDRPFPLSNTTPANFQTAVHVRPLNLAFIQTKGVDVDVSYNFDLDRVIGGTKGNIALRAIASYVDSYTTQQDAGARVIQQAGWTEFSLPKFKARVSANYTNGGFAWRWQMRVIGKLKGGPDRFYANDCRTVRMLPFDCDRIPAYYYFDTTVRQRFEVAGRETEVFLTVNNVFDKVFPLWPNSSGGILIPTIRSVYDRMLRYYTAGVRVTF